MCHWTIPASCALVAALAGAAHAGSLIPGPTEPTFDATLAGRMRQFDRQYDTLNALPFGVSLDAQINNPVSRDLVRAWMATDQDFEAFTGLHPFAVIDSFGEYGDLGNFGGFASAGDAWRYIVLRDGGADPADIDAARDRLLPLLDVWHIYTAITGVPGVFARGVRRMTPIDPTAPPMPPGNDFVGPDLHPDFSGTYPDWEWRGDTSKDQAIGYALVLGALWDAIADDPSIAQSYRDRIDADAVALAGALMAVHHIGGPILGQDLDMVIVDVDGDPVTHFGLNAQVISEPDIVVGPGSALQNGFNALLGLGFIKVLHHITGDPTIGTFYYDLIDNRGWADLALTGGLTGISSMYVGNDTNYSNVNMAAFALYCLVRYEGDAALRERYADGLESVFYRPGKAREPAGLGQSWFDLLDAGFRAGGTDEAAVANALDTLGAFHDPPYFNDPRVENCDANEVAANACVGIDGTVIAISHTTATQVYSQDPVPMRIRPPNNYEWRSSPFATNGGGGGRLNPGGDFRGAYWLGRLLQRSATNQENVSPYARDRSNQWITPPLGTDGGSATDGGPPAGDVATVVVGDSGISSGDGAAPGDITSVVGGDAAMGGDAAHATGDKAAATGDPGGGDTSATGDADSGGDHATAGCSCATRTPAVPTLLAWLALGLVGRRRLRQRNSQCQQLVVAAAPNKQFAINANRLC